MHIFWLLFWPALILAAAVWVGTIYLRRHPGNKIGTKILDWLDKVLNQHTYSEVTTRFKTFGVFVVAYGGGLWLVNSLSDHPGKDSGWIQAAQVIVVYVLASIVQGMYRRSVENHNTIKRMGDSDDTVVLRMPVNSTRARTLLLSVVTEAVQSNPALFAQYANGVREDLPDEG